MAIKDPNVLNRINTLHTNLDSGNIEELEKNVSTRLFGVLEGNNNISVDSELYSSIDKVASASDIANYINTAKTGLSNTHVSIPYTGGAFDIPNSVVTLAAVATVADTENTITNMNNAIAGLNTLPGQINTLRSRLEENLNILNDAYNAQSDLEAGGYARRRSNEIQNDINLCGELQNYLRTIDDAERQLSRHPGDAYHEARRDNAKINFNNNRCAGIDEYDNYGADFGKISGQVRNVLTRFTQERSLCGELVRNENRFNKTQCKVPGNLGLGFNANRTVITTPIASAADIDTNRGHIRDWLDELNVLEGQIATLHARYQDNLNKLNKILALQQLEQRMNTTHPGEMRRRQREFNTIRAISNNNLLLGNAAYEPELPNQSVDVGGILGPVALNFINGALGTGFNGGARNSTYSLCDGAGNPLTNNAGKLEIQQGGHTISLGGITFDNTAQTMTINNLQVTPIEGLTFPLILDLNVRVRIHDNDTGLDIDHHKPIHLEITRPILVQADREVAYDSLTPPMNDRISAEYSDEYRENIENEAIWKILREGGNETEVNEIYNNETRRRQLQDRMRRLLIAHFPLNVLSLADLQTGFRTDMTREDRNVPVQYLLNITAFTDYVRNSIPNNLKEYASTAIYNNINTGVRREVLQELIRFQTDIVNNRVDNFDNLVALSRVPGDNEGPESHPDTGLQRMFRRGSRKNNYTKFFEGREASLDDLSLETEKGIIKYGVHVEITGVNNVTATIKIDGKDEPEIIDAANHDRLIKGILNMANTSDGEPLNRKLRCNIALSVLKAMVMMSPKTLIRQIPPRDFTDNRGNAIRCDRLEAHVKNGNLVIRGGVVNPATGIGGPNPRGRTRRNVEIFNEESFKNLHDVNQLCDGIQELSRQINSIMNATAQEYNEATNRILRNKSLRKYNTTQFLRFGPVKRLWGRMVHGKTNTDFNFSTSVNEAGKDVKISFNKGKFTVAGNFDGQQYEYKAKDLGSILRKKINRKRVFDGVELAMIGAINEEFIKKLRTNSLVQTENFAVADLDDNKTGRIYIFDSRGNLSYLDIEDRNLNPLTTGNAGRIDPDAIPSERRRCSEQERKEFMQNPFLAGRLQRAMRRRLALF